jgi:hypothetical protein
MSTKQHQITVHELVVDVVRKDIKNLHLAVYPPSGRIRVAAPLQVNDEAVLDQAPAGEVRGPAAPVGTRVCVR